MKKKPKPTKTKPKPAPKPPASLPDQSSGQGFLAHFLHHQNRDEMLQKQIEQEQKTLTSTPQVPVSKFQPDPQVLEREHVSHWMFSASKGIVGRCSWCGRVQPNLVLVETIGGVDRYKGTDCCGGRHDGQQIRSTRGIPT